MPSTWLITGCSTGFGRLLAERAFSLGANVVATARSVQSLHDIGAADPARVLQVPLDVTSDESVGTAVAAATDRFGAVDVLVNNAGYGYFATQEDGEIDEVRRMFDTNVLGAVRVTQALLPSMRRRGTGTIVNISSVAGRIATPRGGFYQATKWALEALSEALYLETCEFGIRVVVIEPGSFDTDFSRRSARIARADEDGTSAYLAMSEGWQSVTARSVYPELQDPAEVIDAVADAVESTVPFVRLAVGRDAQRLIDRREELSSVDFVEWMRTVYRTA